MKHFKTVHVPAAPACDKQEYSHTTCDLCKQNIRKGLGSWDVSEVGIYYKKGQIFPEGGFGDAVDIDMCGECFENKFIPWLKSLGVDAQFTKWDS